MTVDILLSTYNGARWIDEQMESLLAQNYSDIKILIRDDGSKDETPALLKKWKDLHPDKIELLLEENVGVIASFNRVYALSKSPYLAFCDQDDVWLPTKIEKGMELLLKAPPMPLLIHSDLVVVDQDKKVIDPSFWNYSYLSGDEKYAVLNRLLVQNVVTGCATLFNRELADLAFPVPQRALMHDWWLALVASCFGKVLSIKEPQILYRQHGNNTLGAKPYALLSNPRKNFNRLILATKHERHRIRQVKSFLDRYRDQLPKSKINMLNDLIGLKKASIFKRIRSLIGHQFYKVGWKRNIFYLLIKIRQG